MASSFRIIFYRGACLDRCLRSAPTKASIENLFELMTVFHDPPSEWIRFLNQQKEITLQSNEVVATSEEYFVGAQHSHRLNLASEREEQRYLAMALVSPNESLSDAMGAMLGIIKFMVRLGYKRPAILLLKDFLKQLRQGEN